MSSARLFFFGPVHVEQAGELVELNLNKGKALLAYLMVTARPHTRDALATMFWPESDGSRGRAALRRVLYKVQQVLGEEVLATTVDTIGRNPEAELWVDVEAFRQAATRCAEAQGELTGDCLEGLEAAVALYQDEFLAGLTLEDSPAFDEWQFFEREALRRELARALVQLSSAYEAAGNWDGAVGATRRWVALDPLHEPAQRQLMRLYALAGQQAAALRQYEECVRLLDEEMGLTPEAATTALYEAIRSRQLGPAGVGPPGATVQWSARRATARTLPADSTPFLGRDREVAEIRGRLADPACRLLTLVGPGGVGKSRLALEVARECASSFHDGAAFASLQPLRSASLLSTAIAHGLHLPLSGNEPPDVQLLAYLQDKELMLLLDNFEHLLAEDEGIALLKGILGGAPGVRLLVTSRTVLSLQEEWRYPVQGLPVPTSPNEADLLAYGAVALFVERARQMAPGFSLDAERAGVVRICQLVDGLPLALELAASWLPILHPQAIAGEIQKQMNFLATSLRDVPERHRSMEVVFEQSWRQLENEERDVFKRLSVFRGGFRREAAQTVAGASLRTLSALVDRSLLRRDAAGRYQVHELLRQYGEEQLAQEPAEVAATRDRYSRTYAQFLAERLDEVQRFRRREGVDAIRAEWDNVRSAWRWAVEQKRLADLADAAAAIFVFCQGQGHFLEGEQAFEAAIEGLRSLPAGDERDLLLARLFTYQGWLCIRLGRLAQARALIEESQALYTQYGVAPPAALGGDPGTALGVLELVEGRYAAAAAVGEAVRRASEARGDPWNLMFARYVLGNAALAQGEIAEARQWTERALALGERLDARWFLAYLFNDLGSVAQAEGYYEEAEGYYQRSYVSRAEQEDPEGMALALSLLGKNAALQGTMAEAEALYGRAVGLYRTIGDRGGLASALNGLSQSARARGQYEAAGSYLREALQIAGENRLARLAGEILLNVAQLLLETGSRPEGLQVLHTVQHHAGSDHATRETAQRLLEAHGGQATGDEGLTGDPVELDALSLRLLPLLARREADRASRAEG